MVINHICSRRWFGVCYGLLTCLRASKSSEMEVDSWRRLFSSSSRRHQLSLQSRDEEVGGMEEDSLAEVSCLFCAEDFDIIGRCCHIDDEHPQEANSRECFNLGQLHRTCFVQSALLGSSHSNTL